MDWDKVKTHFPEAYDDIEMLATLEPETSPQEIDGKLRGAIKGRLVKALGEDDGRYFLKTLWDIKDGSTLNLSQTQGSRLKIWLRVDGNEDMLPGIVDALRVFEAAQASAVISAERKAEAGSEIQRVAKEIGATIKGLDEDVLEEIADTLERTIAYHDELQLGALPEAPASFNFYASIRGFNGQFTLRGWDEGRLLRRAYALIMGLEELGVFPVDRYGNQVVTVNNAGVIAEAKETPVAPAQKATPKRQQAQATTTQNGYEKFLVKEIVAQVTPNGNPYYAVKGAQYMKYGVTAWPEVAEQIHGLFDDIHLDDLNTTETWNVVGRNLFALAEKPEGEKFAQKVVEFVIG